jgi:hypothetical protein
MEPRIGASSADARMSGLEYFLQRYLGPRLPEFGGAADEVLLNEMPDPLQRFFSFAGRWPGHAAFNDPRVRKAQLGTPAIFCSGTTAAKTRSTSHFPRCSHVIQAMKVGRQKVDL